MTNYSEVKVANSAKGTLAGGISANQGTLSLLGGEGAKFPTLNTGEYFYITVTSAALATNTEIMRVTSRSADTLTIKQANGSARNLNNTFSAGDSVELRTTANAINDLFDLENILPDVPAQPDKFGFRVPSGGVGTRYIGPNGVVDGSSKDEDRKFAIKSDGTNATYEALNPNDISDDNNTSTGFVSIPVRGHPYIPHERGNYFVKTLVNSSTNGGLIDDYEGTLTEQTTATMNLYALAEDHDVPIQEGSLVQLANISENNRLYAGFGEHFTAYTTTNAAPSNIVVINDIRRSLNMNGAGSYNTINNWQANVFVGSFLFPPADLAGLVDIPPGTYITRAVTANHGTNTYQVTLYLNNSVTLPATKRVQFYKSRHMQLGRAYSASRQGTVYYKRENTAPAAQTINGESGIKNVKEDAYMPVPGQIANVYTCVVTNKRTSTQFNFDYATNETNGAFETTAGGHFGVTVKPLSVNSVFTIKVYVGLYSTSSYGGMAFYCDYIDADPQPNNTRIFKNPSDNTAAKAVFLIGRHMFIDRFKQPEFNSSVYNPGGSDNGTSYGFSNGQIVPGTWPDNATGMTQQPQTFNGLNDYVTHNNGDDVNGAADDNQYFAASWHNRAYVFNGITGTQFFRPGVTDKVRFRLQFYREANSGTMSINHVSGQATLMVVEEYVQPYGSFGFDIPGGLDTTAHWQGNLI